MRCQEGEERKNGHPPRPARKEGQPVAEEQHDRERLAGCGQRAVVEPRVVPAAIETNAGV
jgi:hypothetical protein